MVYINKFIIIIIIYDYCLIISLLIDSADVELSDLNEF